MKPSGPQMGISRRSFMQVAACAAAAMPAVDAMAGQRGGTGAAANVGPASPVSIGQIEKDVVYGKGGAMDLKLDIYHPRPGTEKRMATIHLHGGGFTGGSKETLSERIKPFAANGYLAIASQYRLLGPAKWPAMIEDAKAAIRWTRVNAERLGVDPSRIVVVGYSAGGFLALTAAGTQDRPEFEGSGGNANAGTRLVACVAYYPVVDGGPPGSTDPSMNINRFPPTVLFHGVADNTVPVESSQRLFQLLRQGKIPSELHTFAGQDHVFDRDPKFAIACANLADLFIEKNVSNRS